MNIAVWMCETCETMYEEYVNGCPKCWDKGVRSGVNCVPLGFAE